MFKKISLYIICLIMSLSIMAIKRSQIVEAQTLQNPTVAISAGGQHTVILKKDGTVWVWGNNINGNYGDGTTTTKTSPTQVKGLNDIVAISAGNAHTIALKNDGTVWAWGANNSGQLGDGTYVTRSVPVQVTGLSGITAISAGESHTVALKNDGTVWAWGGNYDYQLGNGTQTKEPIPIQVKGLNGITLISTNRSHTLALKNDGTLWGWGDNFLGQLGVGTTPYTTTPSLVNGISGDIKSISTGECYSIILKNDGTVWGLGSNSNGQIGDLVKYNTNTPTPVSGLSNIIAVSTANSHTIALKSDGTVWSLGNNFYGELGDGTNTSRSTPSQISTLNGVTSISVSHWTSIALKNDSTVWAWGDNFSYQLGDGTRVDKNTPVQALFVDYIDSVSLERGLVNVGYSKGDYSTSVTKDIALPTSGINGTTITWNSSNPSIISNEGKINRPGYFSGDANITLTATITKGTFSDTKNFIVTVIKNPLTDAESVNLDKQLIKIGYVDGDSSTNITQNIKLPTAGHNGTTISWSSGNSSVISNLGVVNRPSYVSGDVNITLSATITKGTISEKISFPITVKAKAMEEQVVAIPSTTNTTSTTVTNTTLPKTGSKFDYFVLNLIGISFIFIGIIMNKNKRLN